MSNYLVTGGAGFIGSHLVSALLDRGHLVRVLDNFATGKRENLTPFSGRFELIEGSLADFDTCRRACEGVDYVLHQGALPSVPRSVADPLGTNEANVVGTLNLLLAARDKKVRRVVYAASSSAYGDTQVSPKHEELPTNPKSPYAVSKLAGECYCRAFSEVYGLDTVSLRYFNVFGPRQDPTSQYSAVIPKFITALLEGQSPVVNGDGKQSRDFTFVANNVEANLLAAECPEPLRGRVMNVACGQQYSLLDLLKHLREILGSSVEPQFGPSRPGDVRHSCAEISLASRVLKYKPVVGFRDGLEQTVAYYRMLLGL